MSHLSLIVADFTELYVKQLLSFLLPSLCRTVRYLVARFSNDHSGWHLSQ